MNIPNRFVLVASVSALASCTVAQPSAQHAVVEQGEHTAADNFLGVRVLKADGAADHLDWSVELPANCAACRLQVNRFTSGENPREFYFHFLAPGTLNRVDGIRVKVDPAQVRGVLVGRAHVPFTKTPDGISFDAPRNGPALSELSTFNTLQGLAWGQQRGRGFPTNRPGQWHIDRHTTS